MDRFTAHLDRGWDLVTKGDLVGALCSAQEGLEIDNDSPEVHNLMGYIHAQQGDVDTALQHYDQATALDETYIEAILNAAELLIHPLHRFPEAAQKIDEALEYCETADEIADALILKIDALLQHGQRDEAHRTLKRLPDGPFENPELVFRVGRARFDAGDAESGFKLIEQAAELSPVNPEALYYLGLALDARGDSRLATLRFLQVRDLDLQLPPPPWAIPPDQFERRVKTAIGRLPLPLQAHLDNSLVVVCETPGAEVVAQGVDPRAPLLFDSVEGEGADVSIGHIFVYQRNIERVVLGVADIEDELFRCLEHELTAVREHPTMAKTRQGPLALKTKA